VSEPELHAYLCWALIGVAALTALALSVFVAPYGRHTRAGWGPTMPTRWGWIVMESPAVLVFVAVYLLGTRRFEVVPLAFLSLWQIHYLYRAWIFPWRMRAAGKRTPIVVVAMGMLFNVLNAYLNARHVSELAVYPQSWLVDPRFLAGVALFLAGRQLNVSSDARLFELRAQGSDYSIPRGGAFRWVSCPNYLGEIVEWIGWALATWSLAGAAFAVFAVANLAPRSRAHHRWYRERFADYPSQRKALVPLLW
jgi:protein-S-isoprenylcysteine O-methyltransferase Ste14